MAIDLGRSLDVPRRGIHYCVSGDSRPVHRDVGALVLVLEVPPEPFLFDTTRNSEVGLLAGRRKDKPSAGDEVAAAGTATIAGDVGVGRGNDDVGDPRHCHVQRVDRNIARPSAVLLVDYHGHAAEKRDRFIRRSRHRDRVAVDDQLSDLR